MRINALDGLRVISIFIVMLFHYFSRFYNEIYTYSVNTDHIFDFGHLGVQLFFIISGFVIFLTLESSVSLWSFLKKRYIRLAPAMFICSFLTFIIYFIVKPPFRTDAYQIENFIFSNTFLPPAEFNLIFKTDFNYIDGAYWSIWVEICFYLIISFIYFIDKKNVIRNFTVFCIAGAFLWFGFHYNAFKGILLHFIDLKYIDIIKYQILGLKILRFSFWFLIGIYLFKLHKNREHKYLVFIFLIFLVLSILEFKLYVLIFNITVFLILCLFIYKPNWLSFLETGFMSKMGVSTYAVYLIHQNLGILFINKFSYLLGEYNIILGFIAIILSFYVGFLIYNHFEKPVGKSLKKKLI